MAWAITTINPSKETLAAPSAKPAPRSIEAPSSGPWVSPKQVAEMLSISEATLYRWVKYRAKFPRPVKLSPGCSRFNLPQLLAYVSRLEAGNEH